MLSEKRKITIFMSLDLNFHEKHFEILDWQLQWIYDVIESSTSNSNLLTHSAKQKKICWQGNSS